MDELDSFFPPCGPCAFCGHPDKRHRLWDKFIAYHYERKMTAEEISQEFESAETLNHIKAVLRIRPYQDRNR